MIYDIFFTMWFNIASFNCIHKSYFQFFGHHLIQYLKKFNKKKLQPTSHFFKQLLHTDRIKFNGFLSRMSAKKIKIDGIMAQYNKGLNLQGCKENLGIFYFF